MTFATPGFRVGMLFLVYHSSFLKHEVLGSAKMSEIYNMLSGKSNIGWYLIWQYWYWLNIQILFFFFYIYFYWPTSNSVYFFHVTLKSPATSWQCNTQEPVILLLRASCSRVIKRSRWIFKSWKIVIASIYHLCLFVAITGINSTVTHVSWYCITRFLSVHTPAIFFLVYGFVCCLTV